MITEGSCSGVSIMNMGNARVRKRRECISEVTYVQLRLTIKGSLHSFLTPFHAVYNQKRLATELIRQAHNRLLGKAKENVANQRKRKFYKR